MKALTIYQPYASLVAVRAKRFDTHTWYTSYRGPIAIHAAKKRVEDVLDEMFPDYITPFEVAFVSTIRVILGQEGDLPHGAIIAKAQLVGCYKISHIQETAGTPIEVGYWKQGGMVWCDISEQEQLFGNWSAGNYAWELQNVIPLDEPIPCRGYQRIWNWDER